MEHAIVGAKMGCRALPACSARSRR